MPKAVFDDDEDDDDEEEEIDAVAAAARAVSHMSQADSKPSTLTNVQTEQIHGFPDVCSSEMKASAPLMLDEDDDDDDDDVVPTAISMTRSSPSVSMSFNAICRWDKGTTATSSSLSPVKSMTIVAPVISGENKNISVCSNYLVRLGYVSP